MANLRNGSFGEYYGSFQGESGSLTMDEMTVNANYIRSYLMSKGWRENAIFALLGNMQAESSLNPGRWQSEDVGNTSMGYGLVQWTPATKYIDWCSSQGLNDYSTMDNNLARIIYEVENGLQWIPTATYNMTFEEFSKSLEPIENLTRAFMLCYERPADQSEEAQEGRVARALIWYSYVHILPVIPAPGTTPGESGKKKKRKYNFLIFGANRRRQQQNNG